MSDIKPGLTLLDTTAFSVAGRSLTIDEEGLKYLWANGILADTGYIALALKMEGDRWKADDARLFDVPAFISRWETGREVVGAWKPKVLRPSAVLSAINKLEAAALASSSLQITLKLGEF